MIVTTRRQASSSRARTPPAPLNPEVKPDISRPTKRRKTGLAIDTKDGILAAAVLNDRLTPVFDDRPGPSRVCTERATEAPGASRNAHASSSHRGVVPTVDTKPGVLVGMSRATATRAEAEDSKADVYRRMAEQEVRWEAEHMEREAYAASARESRRKRELAAAEAGRVTAAAMRFAPESRRDEMAQLAARLAADIAQRREAEADARRAAAANRVRERTLLQQALASRQYQHQRAVTALGNNLVDLRRKFDYKDQLREQYLAAKLALDEIHRAYRTHKEICREAERDDQMLYQSVLDLRNGVERLKERLEDL